MAKRELAWLVIRLAGLYFLWNAVTSALTFVAGVQLLDGTPRGAVFVQALIVIVIYTALGLYCVNDGRVFFYILNRESDG